MRVQTAAKQPPTFFSGQLVASVFLQASSCLVVFAGRSTVATKNIIGLFLSLIATANISLIELPSSVAAQVSQTKVARPLTSLLVLTCRGLKMNPKGIPRKLNPYIGDGFSSGLSLIPCLYLLMLSRE